MQIKLPPSPRNHTNSPHARVAVWKRAQPFFKNPAGLLIHRVAHVTTFVWHSGHRHTHVGYLCNNGTNTAGDFLAAPPKGRLLCEACELAAARRKLPSADKLVGRHVHVGRIRAYRVCCGGESGEN